MGLRVGAMMATVICYWKYFAGRGDQWVLVSEDGRALAAINELADLTRMASGPLVGEGGRAFHELEGAKRTIENLAIAAGYELRYG
jgi:hypothetical protein